MGGIRIIGGRHRGRRLLTPADQSIRPTSERAREALFNILDHAGFLKGARFLDLYSGTGAVGLEAWSRGADEVWLIDQDIQLASANVAALGQPEMIHTRRLDAPRLGRPPCRFDLVFLDPPYRSGLATETLKALLPNWLAEGAMIIVELAAKESLDLPAGFDMTEDRRYGAARLVFLQTNGQSEAKSEPS